MTLSTILSESAREFDERFPNLNDSTEEGGYEAKDYAHDFLLSKQRAVIEAVIAYFMDNRGGDILQIYDHLRSSLNESKSEETGAGNG